MPIGLNVWTALLVGEHSENRVYQLFFLSRNFAVAIALCYFKPKTDYLCQALDADELFSPQIHITWAVLTSSTEILAARVTGATCDGSSCTGHVWHSVTRWPLLCFAGQELAVVLLSAPTAWGEGLIDGAKLLVCGYCCRWEMDILHKCFWSVVFPFHTKSVKHPVLRILYHSL